MLRLSPPALTACLRQPLGVGFPFPQRRSGLPPPHRIRLSVENQIQIYDLFPIANNLSHVFFAKANVSRRNPQTETIALAQRCTLAPNASRFNKCRTDGLQGLFALFRTEALKRMPHSHKICANLWNTAIYTICTNFL